MASCIFIHAPSDNLNYFFDGDKPSFTCQDRVIRNIPLTVRRRIYSLLVQISSEIIEETALGIKDESLSRVKSANHSYIESSVLMLKDNLTSTKCRKVVEASSLVTQMDDLSVSVESSDEMISAGISTPLHGAAKSGNVQKVLELLEQGSEPCAKDEREQTPYTLASEKEVRIEF